MLGRRDGIAFRGVEDDDAALGGGFYVDVVDADAGPADDLEVLRGGDDVLGDFGLAAHNKCVVFGNEGDEFLRRQLLFAVDRIFLGQNFNAGFGDWIAD